MKTTKLNKDFYKEIEFTLVSNGCIATNFTKGKVDFVSDEGVKEQDKILETAHSIASDVISKNPNTKGTFYFMVPGTGYKSSYDYNPKDLEEQLIDDLKYC